MLTRLCVSRGHSAAVYTSGRWSTSVGHQNTLFIRGPHRCSSEYYRGASICEACTKQVSIQALQRTKKILQLGTLPKQTIVPHFQAMFHIPISAIKYLC
ncbi:hypothetical protein AB205_0213040 [Aquarana catesbeiana]|uniref:Uncharacterized protein n=1 Tax=Aquarana catesbeiana TaxID=8400 RepID=A0A2G9Q2U6_AQUCT|nr:hypothetical protein AB205_0213040 [Aquarana catesbeiana]